ASRARSVSSRTRVSGLLRRMTGSSVVRASPSNMPRSNSRTFGLRLSAAATAAIPVCASPTILISLSGSRTVRQAARAARPRSAMTTLMAGMPLCVAPVRLRSQLAFGLIHAKSPRDLPLRRLARSRLLERIEGELQTSRDSEFLEDGGQMSFDRALGHIQLL